MSPLQLAHANPFGITKAVDLNDEQILSLWVDVAGDAADFAEFSKPVSPMPTFIMGAKGSGKTHLMRYHSFELQELRYRNRGLDLREGVLEDKYVGIYLRCSGLNSGRFTEKRQSPEVWKELFAYYLELWLSLHLLHIVSRLRISEYCDERAVTCEITALFDKPFKEKVDSIDQLRDTIASLQRSLDFEVNNCVLTGKINTEILATRGRLIFGIPKIIAKHVKFLRHTMFVYELDEFENLTLDQQKLVNTLVREKELPATLRIGSRLYGIKTHATDSAEEENLRNSEFESIYLDQIFRTHKKRYSTFARELIDKRLAQGFRHDGLRSTGSDPAWANLFETIDETWDSLYFSSLVKGKTFRERRHFQILREKLRQLDMSDTAATRIIRALASTKFPLLEKNNILIFYQEISKGNDPAEAAGSVHEMCRAFVETPTMKGRYGGTLDHFKNDLIAQLRRENDEKQCYVGAADFIAMSAGLPRALLTILRSVFEWSFFNGEEPLKRSRISLPAQQRGVKDASDWFYENMRKAGEDGMAIQSAIDRLAQYFRVNRFADKPVECSLITFSFSEQDVSHEALRILRLCESRSFLNKITGGQRDKNSERVNMKFQLNNMLSPRWDLPLGRRGTVSLDARAFNAIFDFTKRDDFHEVLSEWRDRMTAPHFGKNRLQKDAEPQRMLI